MLTLEPSEFLWPAPRGLALVHGFGAMGRGLFAEIFRRSGYAVVGIDRSRERVEEISRAGAFKVHFQSPNLELVETIDHVRALHADDRARVVAAYGEAAVAAVALMPEALDAAVDVIAEGLLLRARGGGGPLALLLCVNRPGGVTALADGLRAALGRRAAPAEVGAVLANTELLGCVVNRIARGPHRGDARLPLSSVFADPSFTLLVARGRHLPALRRVRPVTDLRPHEDLKRFLFSSAHALAAYGGHGIGCRYIHEALEDPALRADLRRLLFEEAGPALVGRWPQLTRRRVERYAAQVLARLGNPGLQDELGRVARDSARKLGPEDRLVGAARLVWGQGRAPTALCRAIALAVAFDGLTGCDAGTAAVQARLANEGIRGVLRAFCGLEPVADAALVAQVEAAFAALHAKAPAPGAGPPRNVPRVFLADVADPAAPRAALLPHGLSLNLRTGQLGYQPDFRPLALRCGLTFVRHGQTFANVEPRHFQGQVDEAKNQLSERGRAQAEEVARRLLGRMGAGWRPDVIYSSPLGRARETARPFVAAADLDGHLRVLPEAREMSFGPWDNQRLIDLPPDHRAHLFYLHQNALVKGQGGESFAELLLRARRVLLWLDRHHAGGRVLLFSHSMFGAACAILLGKGRPLSGQAHLAFDGEHVLPHCVPVELA